MTTLSEELWRALMAGFVEVVAVLDDRPIWRLTPLHLPACSPPCQACEGAGT